MMLKTDPVVPSMNGTNASGSDTGSGPVMTLLKPTDSFWNQDKK